MGILDRINTLIRANVNDLVRRADEPERALDGSLRDMERSVREARARLREVERSEASILSQWERRRAELLDWEERAMTALRRGDEALARECLVMKKRAEAATVDLEEQLSRQRAYMADLARSLDALEVKIDGVRSRRQAISSRVSGEQAPQGAPGGGFTFNFGDDDGGGERAPRGERGAARERGDRWESPRWDDDSPSRPSGDAPRRAGGLSPAEERFSSGRRAFVFDEDLRREHPEEVFGASRPFEVFDEMEERMERRAASAAASAELGGYVDPLRDEREALEARFDKMARRQELADLRRRATEEPPPARGASASPKASTRREQSGRARRAGGDSKLSDLRRSLMEELDE